MTGNVGRPSLRGQVAPIAAITIFGVSMSMSYPLFALLLERGGASGSEIGLNATAASVAMVLSAPLMPGLMRRVGIGPLMIVSAVLMAGVFLAAPVFDGLAGWSALRFAYGVFGTALFFASEFWIVAVAPPGRRGRLVALYGVSLSAGFMAGPALLGLTGLDGVLPFAVAAGVVLTGVVPILWGIAAAPAPFADEKPGMLESLGYFRSDPALLWAIFLFGTIEYGALALVSVWGVRAGLAEADAVLLLSLFAAGAMALQYPLGAAADRYAPRRLLLLAALAVSVAPVVLIYAAPALVPLAAAMLVWGGFGAGLYALTLVALGNRYSGQRLAEANAAVILAYGLGALVSPLAFGWAMDAAPPHGLLWASAAVALAYLLLLAVRIRQRPRESP